MDAGTVNVLVPKSLAILVIPSFDVSNDAAVVLLQLTCIGGKFNPVTALSIGNILPSNEVHISDVLLSSTAMYSYSLTIPEFSYPIKEA